MKTKRALFFLLSIMLLTSQAERLSAKEKEEQHIQWITDYDKAVELSKKTSKPIVLFFTGSDWCGWCTKLEKEVLLTKDFIQSTSDALIFVKLDFPMRSKQDPATRKQNDQLKKKFAIRGFPSLVILDPDQQPIGVTGYRSGGGKQYAQHLKKMIHEYTAYKQKMHQLGAVKFSGKDLKRLYQKAHELGLASDQNLLIRVGLESDLAHFFATERYRYLVSHGQITSEEAVSLKERLHTLDPTNQHLTHYQLAVIEFEYFSDNQELTLATPDQVVAPLLSYIRSFGSEDNDNVWRLHMIISQVFLDQNLYAKALNYAEKSYSSAPASIQPEIGLAIKNIEQQMP